MRSALEWAQVRVLVADGVSEREIARRLGINRRTVARLAAAEEPPRYRRAPAGSKLDPLVPVRRRLLVEWPQIKAPRATELLRDEYGYDGSVDLVKRRLRALRPPAVRPAQRTGYRPGQVLQLDWAEMESRPTLSGRERRVYALVDSLPVGCTNTISLQIPDFTTGEFVHATPSAELDASPGFGSSAECPTRTRGFLGPAGQSDPTVNLSVFWRHPCGASALGSACKSG